MLFLSLGMLHSLTHLIPGIHTLFLTYCMLDRESHIIPVIGYVQKVLIYVIPVIRYVTRVTKVMTGIRYVQNAWHKVCNIE